MSAPPGAPAALVMARAPTPGRCKTRLEALLGARGCAALQRALIRRASAWASAAAPSAAFMAGDPPDALDELRALAPPGTGLLGQQGADLGARLTAAVAAVMAGEGRARGPLLVVGADLPTLDAGHARDALGDLGAGCDVVLGPALDGGYYLIGLARPLPALFALPPGAWGGPDVLALTLRAAAELGLEVGLLCAERDLDTPADARAALADPLLAPEIAAVLREPAPR